MQGWNETPVEVARRKTEYREAWGNMLRSQPWAHWLTLTSGEQVEPLGDVGRRRRLRCVRGVWRVSARPLSTERIRKAFEDEFIRFCQKAAVSVKIDVA